MTCAVAIRQQTIQLIFKVQGSGILLDGLNGTKEFVLQVSGKVVLGDDLLLGEEPVQ